MFSGMIGVPEETAGWSCTFACSALRCGVVVEAFDSTVAVLVVQSTVSASAAEAKAPRPHDVSEEHFLESTFCSPEILLVPPESLASLHVDSTKDGMTLFC